MHWKIQFVIFAFGKDIFAVSLIIIKNSITTTTIDWPNSTFVHPSRPLPFLVNVRLIVIQLAHLRVREGARLFRLFLPQLRRFFLQTQFNSNRHYFGVSEEVCPCAPVCQWLTLISLSPSPSVVGNSHREQDVPFVCCLCCILAKWNRLAATFGDGKDCMRALPSITQR